MSTEDAIREHLEVVQAAASGLVASVDAFAALLIDTFAAGGTVYTFGNGGSAADAQHLAAELIGRYRDERAALPAVALSTDPSVVTCIANDYGYEQVFARQVSALVGPEDLVVAYSTSGESRSVVQGLLAARRRGARTVALTGRAESSAGGAADVLLAVPSTSTARIQEVHTLITHLVSARVDAWMASERSAVGTERGA